MDHFCKYTRLFDGSEILALTATSGAGTAALRYHTGAGAHRTLPGNGRHASFLVFSISFADHSADFRLGLAGHLRAAAGLVLAGLRGAGQFLEVFLAETVFGAHHGGVHCVVVAVPVLQRHAECHSLFL